MAADDRIPIRELELAVRDIDVPVDGHVLGRKDPQQRMINCRAAGLGDVIGQGELVQRRGQTRWPDPPLPPPEKESCPTHG